MRVCVVLRHHTDVLQRLADMESEASVEARVLPSATTTIAAHEVSAAADLQLHSQVLQGRFAKIEPTAAKDSQAAAAEHADQLHRLHHKLAAAEMQVLSLEMLLRLYVHFSSCVRLCIFAGEAAAEARRCSRKEHTSACCQRGSQGLAACVYRLLRAYRKLHFFVPAADPSIPSNTFQYISQLKHLHHSIVQNHLRCL